MATFSVIMVMDCVVHMHGFVEWFVSLCVHLDMDSSSMALIAGLGTAVWVHLWIFPVLGAPKNTTRLTLFSAIGRGFLTIC